MQFPTWGFAALIMCHVCACVIDEAILSVLCDLGWYRQNWNLKVPADDCKKEILSRI